MSLTIEQTKIPKIDPIEEIARIGTLTDPNDQFLAFSHNYPFDASRLPEVMSGEAVKSLIDFASDPDSSTSLLIRAQAFELGAKSLLSDDDPDEQATALKKELEELLPKGVLDDIYTMQVPNPPEGWTYTNGLFNFGKYPVIIDKLVKKEGIDPNYVFPDYYTLGYPPDYEEALPDNIPSIALILLESLRDKIHDHDGSRLLPISTFSKLIPLAVDILETAGGEPGSRLVDFSDPNAVKRDAEEIGAFIDASNEQRGQYVEQLLDLKSASALLRNVFPAVYSEGVRKGAEKLFAECLYAMSAHTGNGGVTDVELPLNGNPNNSLRFITSEDGPLEITRELVGGMRELNRVYSHPEMFTTRVTQSDGYSLFRLWVPGDGFSSVSVYIRAEADVTYDPKVEYGRNGEGVEASISFVVDPSISPGQIIEVGKHRGKSPDNRISIRLDREGVNGDQTTAQRDPTQEQGTLSLDVGSIIGDESWLGTKVGRFLAYGDLLASQSKGQSSDLNHVRRYFSQEDGSAESFAQNARELIKTLEARQVKDPRALRAKISQLVAVS